MTLIIGNYTINVTRSTLLIAHTPANGNTTEVEKCFMSPEDALAAYNAAVAHLMIRELDAKVAAS